MDRDPPQRQTVPAKRRGCLGRAATQAAPAPDRCSSHIAAVPPARGRGSEARSATECSPRTEAAPLRRPGTGDCPCCQQGVGSPKRAQGSITQYARKGPISMATYVITHEVDEVEHWLRSPKREEVFGPMGITVRTFRDPDGSKKTALIAEIPDIEAFQEVMKSEAAADAMKHDGVDPKTLLMFSEAPAVA